MLKKLAGWFFIPDSDLSNQGIFLNMTRNLRKKTIMVALGGNALIRDGQIGTIQEQFDNLKIPIQQIARLSQEYRIIITHGNGPQVGELLLKEEAIPSGRRMPLEILVAQTQGQIGYMIESVLDSQLMEIGVDAKPIVSLISYVVVDEKDPAFKKPDKPIGPAHTEKEAALLNYPVKKTAKGYRRVVASPKPVTIVEKLEIKKLINMDFIVICCGGGGIPVKRKGRTFCGVDAVIDKDMTSAKLAEEVDVDIFIIATDVHGAALNYGRPDEKYLKTLTYEKAAEYLEKGYFPPGSMGPKIKAAVEFVKNKKKRAVVTFINSIEDAVNGKAGTEIK